jgi:hypothetical protein
MKKSFQPGAKRRYVLALAAVVVVAIAAVTVISRQNASSRSVADQPRVNESRANATRGRTFVTRRVAGQDLRVDTQTGEIKPLTPQEAQHLANGLAPMLDNSTDGLEQVQHADGSVSMDLDGRFQNVTVVRVNTNGTVEQSCVDSPRTAAKFFGIDRKLIENAPTARKRAIQ